MIIILKGCVYRCKWRERSVVAISTRSPSIVAFVASDVSPAFADAVVAAPRLVASQIRRHQRECLYWWNTNVTLANAQLLLYTIESIGLSDWYVGLSLSIDDKTDYRVPYSWYQRVGPYSGVMVFVVFQRVIELSGVLGRDLSCENAMCFETLWNFFVWPPVDRKREIPPLWRNNLIPPSFFARRAIGLELTDTFPDNVVLLQLHH